MSAATNAGTNAKLIPLPPVFGLELLVSLVSGMLGAGVLVSGVLVSGVLVSGALISGVLVFGVLVSGEFVSGVLVLGVLVLGVLVSGVFVSELLPDPVLEPLFEPVPSSVLESANSLNWSLAKST